MDRKPQHYDFPLYGVLKDYDLAPLRGGKQFKRVYPHRFSAALAVPLLDLLLPVNKAAQYEHLGNFHMAEINLRLLKKEVI